MTRVLALLAAVGLAGTAQASGYEARQAELWQQADRVCMAYEDESLARQDRACLKREMLTRELRGQQWCFNEHGRFWRPCR